MTAGAEKLKILIVEDEALVAMMIEDIVLDLGYEIAAVAGRLDEGVQLARDLTIDAAVVDLNLNGQRTDPIAAILHARGIPNVLARAAKR
jgi:CheY-like chemotaxis protein